MNRSADFSQAFLVSLKFFSYDFNPTKNNLIFSLQSEKNKQTKILHISYKLSTHYKYTFHMLTDGFEKPLGADRVHRQTTQICLHINFSFYYIHKNQPSYQFSHPSVSQLRLQFYLRKV